MALLRSLKVVSVLILALGFCAYAQNSKVENQARTVLIDKLTRVYLNMAPADPSKVGLTLRLADLHAERARIDSMEELNSGCLQCDAGREDRQKSLNLYNEALAKVPTGQLGRVLSQIGHLYQLQGQEVKAIDVYASVLKQDIPEEFKAEAMLSLAEVFFKRRDYAQAESNYQKVLNISKAQNHGLAQYRLAWCKFNLGEVSEAVTLLKKQLTTPRLLSRSDSNQIDRQFHEEVSRDYVTFLVRSGGGQMTGAALVAEVFQSSPASTQMSNVVFLAAELERLGQNEKAISAWEVVLEKQSSPQDRLESEIHLASLKKQGADKAGAIRHFDSALNLWMTLNCTGENCVEIKTRIKNFLVEWNQAEKKNPTAELAQAYANYLKVFQTEPQVYLWAAEVSRTIKDYPVAFNYYQKASGLAGTHQDAALLSMIEVAELSKDSGLLAKAYAAYLSQSKDQKKSLEVKYQQAYLIYQAGNYAQAATELKQVALIPGAEGQTIKKQAADLALDALVLAKQENKIETWSTEFSAVFPAQANEFKAVSRKAVLTQTAAQSSDSAAAWTTLLRFDLSSAPIEEKVTYFKNKLILAEKLQKFHEAREAADALIGLAALGNAKVNEEDLQFALSRKAWLSELVLDFDGALGAAARFNAKTIESDKKFLKLAMFADLATKDPKPYYLEFLKVSKDIDQQVAVNAQLVRTAKNPAVELDQRGKTLSLRPEILADLYLEMYSKQPDAKLLEKANSNKVIAGTVSGKILKRFKILADHEQLKTQFDSAKVDSSTQAKLTKTIKAKATLLENADQLANKALELGDWTAQVVTLSLVANQNELFYQEILSLPIPAGLSPEQEQEYLGLISQQASPHSIKAQDVQKKLAEFWGQAAAVEGIKTLPSKAFGSYAKLVSTELAALASVAPEKNKPWITELATRPLTVGTSGIVVPLKEIEGARQAVRENPFSVEKIEKLLSIEKKASQSAANTAMIDYLEGRLKTAKEQKTGGNL